MSQVKLIFLLQFSDFVFFVHFFTTLTAIISETVSPNVSKLHGHSNLISNNNMVRFHVRAIKNGRFHLFQTDPPPLLQAEYIHNG